MSGGTNHAQEAAGGAVTPPTANSHDLEKPGKQLLTEPLDQPASWPNCATPQAEERRDCETRYALVRALWLRAKAYLYSTAEPVAHLVEQGTFNPKVAGS